MSERQGGMEARLKLNALRAFDALARTGSVRGGADALNVTSGAVSRHIAALNEDLGVTLVEPDGRGLRLTAAGRKLAQRLKPAFDEIDKAVALTRAPAAVRRTVRLAVAMMFAKAWLLPRLQGFGGEVDFVFNDAGAGGWSTSEADLVITWGSRPGGDEYAAEKFGEEETFPVCAPGVGRRIEEHRSLAGVPLLHYADIPSGWDWPSWPVFLERTRLDDAGAGRDIHLGRGLIMDAARAGQGLALANTTLAHDDLAAGHLVRPVAASMAVEGGYWLLTPVAREAGPDVSAFCDWLRSEYAACFGARAGFVRRTPAGARRQSA